MLGKDGNASPFGEPVPNSLVGPASLFSFGLASLLINKLKK